MHLGIPSIEVLEVTHTVSHGDGIKRIVGKPQVEAVATFESHLISHTSL